jgi:hypothetical protein
MARAAKKGTLVATEVICIVVGARPVKYQRRKVRDRRTGEMVEIDMTDPSWEPEDPGDDGVPYTFRVGQKIWPGHPAYESAKLKDVFIPLEEAQDQDLVEA